MIGNFNRLIELTETEFLMLLPDDDLLYPDYLSSVVEILERNPRVGLVHTAFDEIDIESRVQKHAASYVKSNHPSMVEPGRAFLKRSMTSMRLSIEGDLSDARDPRSRRDDDPRRTFRGHPALHAHRAELGHRLSRPATRGFPLHDQTKRGGSLRGDRTNLTHGIAS